ncbi:MAG TPA: nitroreductase [Micropepsaceae bacterium]|nr:nitroreductase [Micropepsaceae bacterium]
MLTRRSGSAKRMTGPGPSPDELETILTAAMRVPDHGKLAPWRFIVFEGEGRSQFGEVLMRILKANEPDASAERLEIERTRFLRAPVVVGVVSRVRTDVPIPEWEQTLSAGASCFALSLAARALGYVASWVTEWCAYDPAVRAALSLNAQERVAGFIYLGQPSDVLEDRPRPQLSAHVTRFGA